MDFKKAFTILEAMRISKFIPKAIAIAFFINAFAVIDSNIRTLQYKKKAEQYAQWHQNPSEKEKYFEDETLKRKKKIDNLLKTKKINKEKYELELENLIFLKKFKIKESSAKYSYFWNKKADKTFTGPLIFGRQSQHGRQDLKTKTKNSQKIWVMELEKKKIKFKDYMVN